MQIAGQDELLVTGTELSRPGCVIKDHDAHNLSPQ